MTAQRLPKIGDKVRVIHDEWKWAYPRGTVGEVIKVFSDGRIQVSTKHKDGEAVPHCNWEGPENWEFVEPVYKVGDHVRRTKDIRPVEGSTQGPLRAGLGGTIIRIRGTQAKVRLDEPAYTRSGVEITQATWSIENIEPASVEEVFDGVYRVGDIVERTVDGSPTWERYEAHKAGNLGEVVKVAPDLSQVKVKLLTPAYTQNFGKPRRIPLAAWNINKIKLVKRAPDNDKENTPVSTKDRIFAHLTSGEGSVPERQLALRQLTELGIFHPHKTDDEVKKLANDYLVANKEGFCQAGIDRFREATGVQQNRKSIVRIVLDVEVDVDLSDGASDSDNDQRFVRQFVRDQECKVIRTSRGLDAKVQSALLQGYIVNPSSAAPKL